ncbi:agrin-like isoform X2 [Oratosquilla oratoria]|uniref:agrin-like isoform X2 n=1 Tax=Oratosquilla oratoria TaxID=337810 RepID=UPI003F75D275
MRFCPAHARNHPVCGSDGTDYKSQCELSRAACVLQRNVEVRFMGMCDPCSHVVCAPGELCIVNDARVPRCQCNSSCPKQLAPVCSSDGRTYINECLMHYESCRTRKRLSVIYRGECSSVENPCSAVRCSGGKQCAINQYGVAMCECPQWCQPVVIPVCGTDGITYNSLCHLEKEVCTRQLSVSLAYVGMCGSRGPCEGQKCEFGGVCVERYGQSECRCPACIGEYKPVCGNDHDTYDSECALIQHSCLSKTHIEVQSEGKCDACKDVQCGRFGVCEVDENGVGRCSCPTDCSQALGGEVCGSDGRTYRTECELQVAACSSRASITVVHKGNCNLCLDVKCKYGARCEDGNCICPTDCPNRREPVCGSDRYTYNNGCLMMKAACEKNEDIKMAFVGECTEIRGIVTDIIYPTPVDPSDPEDLCHGMECLAGAVCKQDSMGKPRCDCDIYCSPPPRYEPVCGSDLEFYESECLMRQHACNIQVNLTPRPVDDCAKAQVVRACNGSRPLINTNTNEEIYCGDGGTVCPPGTYCHRTQEFAKCCLDNSVRIVVIDEPLPDQCHMREFGCCQDGFTFAKGPNGAGCPETCTCHRLGAVSPMCDNYGQCMCRLGVGGEKCDRCRPGYYGLHRISQGERGCTPCGCSLFGSERLDCEQNQGKCDCKAGVTGHRCNICPKGKVLRSEGCVYEDALVPQPTTCNLMRCHFGGLCEEQYGIATCICRYHCSLPSMAADQMAVCGSDGVTYKNQCELDHQACLQQFDIVVVAFGPCSESRTDAPVRRSTVEEWMPSRGLTAFHALATRRHLTHNEVIDQPHAPVTPPADITGFSGEGEALYEIPSFSGYSYIKLSRWSVPTKIHIDLEVTPYRGDGVLLYTQQDPDGTTDFMAISLVKGYVEFRIDIGNGPLILKSRQPIDLFTSHTIAAKGYHRDFVLLVDDQDPVSVRSVGVHRSLDVDAPVYLGGLPTPLPRVVINAGTSRGIVGCVTRLRLGHRPVDLMYGRSYFVSHSHNVTECRPSPCAALPCSNRATCIPGPVPHTFTCSCPATHTGRLCETPLDPCLSNPCAEGTSCTPAPDGTFACGCPKGWTGPDCSLVDPSVRDILVPQFDGRSFIALSPPEGISEKFTIEIWFLTKALHGVILYEGQGPVDKGDFISLNLVNGYVQFRFDLGSGVANITSTNPVTLGDWHKVIADRQDRQGTLKVDDHEPVFGNAPGPASELNLNMPLYIGGFKLSYMVNRDSGILVGLNGAIQRLVLNNRVMDGMVSSSLEQRGITSFDGPPCADHECRNGGICIPDFKEYRCKCPLHFVGRMCEKSINEIDLNQPVKFDGNTFLRYPNDIFSSTNGSKLPQYIPLQHPDYEYLAYEEDVAEELLEQVEAVAEREEGRQGQITNAFELSFRTTKPDGLLIWTSKGGQGRGDFLALALVSGNPQLTFNLGRSRKPFILNAKTPVDDGEWHVVRVIRRRRRALLKVDNHRPARGEAPRGASILNTDGYLWIGGSTKVPSALGPSYQTGFEGCVDRLLIDGHELHLVKHGLNHHLQFCHADT